MAQSVISADDILSIVCQRLAGLHGDIVVMLGLSDPDAVIVEDLIDDVTADLRALQSEWQ